MALYLLFFGLLTRYPQRSLAMALIPGFLIFIYYSSSRTSLLAIAGAVLVALLLLVFMRRGSLMKMARVIRFGFLLFPVLAFAAFAAEVFVPGIIVDNATAFVLKSGDVASFSADAVLYSRQSLIDMMVANIREQPWTGIGFGTSSDVGFAMRATLLGASTEKGILVIAVIEETGIIGFFFFCLFVIAVFVYSIEKQNVSGLTLFAALLGLNLSEANFFSFGGHGGFFWMWVMAGFILNDATES
jgi:hypothetical protein